MSYVSKHLIEGETIVYTTGLHWIVLIQAIFLTFLFGAGGAALLILYSRNQGDASGTTTAMLAGGIALLVVAAICIVSGIVKRNATEMVVTNKRVVLKVGLVTRDSFELLLS
jgi:hypothetical protein